MRRLIGLWLVLAFGLVLSACAGGGGDRFVGLSQLYQKEKTLWSCNAKGAALGGVIGAAVPVGVAVATGNWLYAGGAVVTGPGGAAVGARIQDASKDPATMKVGECATDKEGRKVMRLEDNDTRGRVIAGLPGRWMVEGEVAPVAATKPMPLTEARSVQPKTRTVVRRVRECYDAAGAKITCPSRGAAPAAAPALRPMAPVTPPAAVPTVPRSGTGAPQQLGPPAPPAVAPAPVTPAVPVVSPPRTTSA